MQQAAMPVTTLSPSVASGRTAACLSLKNPTSYPMSLAKSVAAAGSVSAWNFQNPELASLCTMIDGMCTARNCEEALAQVKSVMSLGHGLWAYAYMRALYRKDSSIYYKALLTAPELLLPVVYTPTVGEACQKFGLLPYDRHGCYISIKDRGSVKKVLQEYAAARLEKDEKGNYLCEYIVFSDGGRILGLGDLGAFGMGIPIGKLDLYTVCGGCNPYRTIPVIIDAGCSGAEGNTAKLTIRDHVLYTGLKQDRIKHTSAAGTAVNSAYYGEGNLIQEFMLAATELFGKGCLLQFEDFNSNDAFPLLAEYRNKFLTYNDDIQGTAAIAVAGIMGSIKIRNPNETDVLQALQQQTFLFYGAGTANMGACALLANEAGVPKSQIFVTNSRGLIWATSTEGSHRNEEQKAFAQPQKPSYDSKDLVTLIKKVKPTCLLGAVGCAPGCFSKEVMEALVEVNKPLRPVVFALSNPKTQAEITAENAYTWTKGTAIYGSGTKFDPVTVEGRIHVPGQVNNVFIFPGLSFGAVSCGASSIPERLFLVAAQAVAESLDDQDFKEDRVVPSASRLREVSLNVATAVVLEAEHLGLASKKFGSDKETVKKQLAKMMWCPK